MSLDITHPEAETFMTIKSDLKKINKANLSVEIDDEFMQKVVNGDSESNRLFDILCEQACKYAEPGVIYTNRFRNYNLMEHVDSYQIETCNPCGEQPLAKHSACNLSSINLSEYVVRPFTSSAVVDVGSLFSDIHHIVKGMDDIIDENLQNHALQEQKDQVFKFRNLGIGVMGVHDMLIKLGLVYGSKEAIEFIQTLTRDIFRESVYASVYLANAKGSFPGYDPKVWDSEIIKNNFTSEEIENLKKKDCLRNCSLLSVAPCGSIGTMLSISTGVEPWFSKSYIRNTKSLNGDKEVSYEVWAPVIKEAMDKNWHPETLITAADIDYKGRIGMQAALQNAIDTAISSTLNLPKTTTPQDIKNIYILAWKSGLKGVTAYVDGSRDPILTTDKTEKKEEIVQTTFNTITPVSRKTLGTTYGATHCKKCACGTLYITTNMDKEGNLVEVFTHTSKGGICQAHINGLNRMVSLGLRSGIKIDELIDQLKGIHCPACQMAKAKGNAVDGLSCPDIVARTLKEFVDGDFTVCQQYSEEEKPIAVSGPKCPECGEPLLATGGCWSCTSCGYSKCS